LAQLSSVSQVFLVDPKDATEAESDADCIADTGVDPSKIAQTPAFVFVFAPSVEGCSRIQRWIPSAHVSLSRFK
jgi:hypothetical protein